MIDIRAEAICRFRILMHEHEPVIKISTTKLSIGRRYPIAPSIIWDIITDTTKWPLWGPTVKGVQYPERFIHKGSKGRVLTVLNVWLPFDIVEYEHARFWTWKVASVRATGHRIRAVDGGYCDLWFDVPLLAAPYTLVCRLALGRIGNLLSDIREAEK